MINALTTGCGVILTAAGLWLVWSLMKSNKTAVASAPARVPDGERLPVLAAAELFAATRTRGLLANIQSKCGFSAEHYQRTVMPVLQAYAEFVQQLPVAGSSHDARPGGLLMHALEMADLALTFRRGQILPKGAAPEDIMRLEHRWTYAVFVAAITHDIAKHLASMCVTLYREDSRVAERWAPLSGTMAECGATYYIVELTDSDERETALDMKLPLFLYQRFLPAEALRWLSNDHELVGELMAVLAGEHDYDSGAIGELVSRAEAQCSKSDPYAGSRAPIYQARDADVREITDELVAAAAQSEPDAPEVVTTDHLTDFEDRTEEQVTAPTPQLASTVALPPPAAPAAAGQSVSSAPPEVALRFMAWLKAGLAQGTLGFNEMNAMVHFVKEGMLLVSPKLFQEFANVTGEERMSPVVAPARDTRDLAIHIQRQLLKADWHVKSEKGHGILTYQVLRPGKPVSSICGIVIAQPDRFVYPIPPANPHLVRAAGSRKD